MRTVQSGDVVQVHFVKVFQDGSVVASRGRLATEVTVGIDHPRLPGLGLALVGMAVGESRTMVVPARDAGGPYDPGLVRQLARTRFATGRDLSAGDWVRVWDRARGRPRRRLVRVVEVRRRGVVVDANRRRAGQSLELEVTVFAIRGPEVPSGEDRSAEGHTPDPELATEEQRRREEGGCR